MDFVKIPQFIDRVEQYATIEGGVDDRCTPTRKDVLWQIRKGDKNQFDYTHTQTMLLCQQKLCAKYDKISEHLYYK